MATNFMQTLMDPVSQGPNSPYGVKSSREYAAALLKGSQEPVQHWAQGIGNIIKALQGGYTEYKAADQEKAGQNSWVQALLGNTQGATPTALPQMQRPQGPQFAAPPPPPNPLVADQPTMSVSDAPKQSDLVARILQAESAGNPNAVNPRSSATGAGQFINSTWLQMIKQSRPDLAAGKSDAELLALRNDPQLSSEMTGAYANQNNKTLQVAGLDPTPGNTYLAHFAGPQGATAILRADPNTPVASILGPQAIQANPQIANMTAAQIRQWADNKVNGTHGFAPPVAPSAAPVSAGAVPTSPAAAPPINRDALIAVLQNPWAPAEAKAMVLKQLGPRDPIKLGEGENLVDPRTFQPLTNNQKTKVTHGVIGKDQFGQEIYGWNDPNKLSVTPTPLQQPQTAAVPSPQAPNATPTDPNDPRNPQIRQSPAGVDPKLWRESETKRISTLTASRPEQEKVANVVTQDIDRALGIIKNSPTSSTGLVGQGLSFIGGTNAKNLDALLNTVKTNVGFDKLQAMRAASPTGAALGSVTENENKMLQSAIGSLELSQVPQQLQDNLRRVKNIYMDIIHGPNNGPKRETLSFEQNQQTAPTSAPQGIDPKVWQFMTPEERGLWK